MAKSLRYRPRQDLKPYKNKARKHSKKQVKQIASSIEAFGFNNPVLIDQSGLIVCGHRRVQAAKMLRLRNRTVPDTRPPH